MKSFKLFIFIMRIIYIYIYIYIYLYLYLFIFIYIYNENTFQIKISFKSVVFKYISNVSKTLVVVDLLCSNILLSKFFLQSTRIYLNLLTCFLTFPFEFRFLH